MTSSALPPGDAFPSFRRSPAPVRTPAKVKSAVTTEEDLGKCVTRPITDARVLAVLRAARAVPELRFVVSPEVLSSVKKIQSANDDANRTQLRRWIRESWTPTDFYKCCFELEPDVRVVGKITAMLDAERRAIVEGTSQVEAAELDGYIYVFYLLSDPAKVVKIGRTVQSPEERRSQWEHELAPQEGQSVILLCAYPTIANMFAESIIHTVFTCQHETARINPLTNRSLTEFFRIPNLMALKIFLRQTTEFIDRFSSYYRARRRRPEIARSMKT